MTDVHVTEEISAFLDGELGAAERSRVAEHLAGCRDCQQQLEELRQLETLAHTLPRELTPPSDIARRVRARLEPKRTLATPWWWAAAAALLLSFVPWMLFRQQSAARVNAPAVREEAEAPKRDATPESKVQPQAKPAVPASPAPAVELNGKKRFAEAPPAEKEARLKDRELDERGHLDEQSKAVAENTDAVANTTTGGEVPPSAAASEPGRRAQNAPAGFAKGASGAGGANARADRKEGYDSAVASDDGIANEDGLRRARIQNGDDARRVREEWLRIFARADGRAQGEPALLAAIEAASAAFHYDHRPDDLVRLRRLAATYLARPNPTAAAHVRRLVARAEAEKAP